MRLPNFNPWSAFGSLFSHTIRCVCIVACIGKAYGQENVSFSDVSSISDIPVIESITVTGSLLPKGDFVSNAPITTLSAEMFEMSNATNVETLINSMPQVIGGTDRTSNFGFGFASAELRGLGSQRTLVLLNSRRFAPSVSDGGTVDLNFIPVGLIDRVEVLTGGASAAYGSDAMAGVINFILKDDIDGWEVNFGSEQTTEYSDARLSNFNITNGGTFAAGRGTYLLHFDVTDRDDVPYSDREISDTRLVDGISDTGSTSLRDMQMGDPGFWGLASSTSMLDPRLAFLGIPNGIATFTSEGNISPASNDAFVGQNANGYLQQGQQRQAFLANFDFEVSDSTTVYGDLTWSKSKVPGTFLPPPMNFPTRDIPFTIDGNPFLTPAAQQTLSASLGTQFVPVPDSTLAPLRAAAAQQSPMLPMMIFQQLGNYDLSCITPASFPAILGFGVIPQLRSDANGNCVADVGQAGDIATNSFGYMGRIMDELGPTSWTSEYEVLQLEIGIEGELLPNWGYDIYVQRGEVTGEMTVGPLISTAKMDQSLLVLPNGECAPSPSADPNCVASNIYGAGNLSSESVAYLSETGKLDVVNTQTVMFGSISGNTMDWFQMPFDAGPIGAAFGFEYLKNETDGFRDAILEPGAFDGWATVPGVTSAETINKSVFMELLVPLASGLTAIDFLELELGARFSDHSDTGAATSYKAAISYFPIADLQIRSSFNRAFRSPSMTELFVPNTQSSTPNIVDPCARYRFTNDAAINAIRDLCVQTGVPDATVGTFGLGVPRVIVDNGANPNLEEETAATVSMGLVWTPYDIEGLSFSIDHFNIEIENFISVDPLQTSPNSGAADIISACYNPSESASKSAYACNQITRSESGQITRVFRGYDNAGTHTLRGWDVNLNYQTDFLDGLLDIGYVATKLTERTIDASQIGMDKKSCLGQFNDDCGLITPVPDYKHRLTFYWSRDWLSLQVVGNTISSLSDGDKETNYHTEFTEDYTTFDVTSTMDVKDNIRITAGLKNATDKQPPVIGSNNLIPNQPVSVNTYPLLYDVFGRTLFIKLNMSF